MAAKELVRTNDRDNVLSADRRKVDRSFAGARIILIGEKPVRAKAILMDAHDEPSGI